MTKHRYTRAKNVWGGWFLAGNHHNYQNWVPSILPYKLSLICMGMKKKKSRKKKSKWPTQKTEIFKTANSQFFLQQFRDTRPWVSRIIFLGLSPRILVKIYRVEWMGLNFCDYSGFKQKITHPKHYLGEWYTAYVISMIKSKLTSSMYTLPTA